MINKNLSLQKNGYIFSKDFKKNNIPAIYLNKMTNRQFKQIEAIVPHGTNVSKYPFKCRVSRNKIIYETGISTVETPYGNFVKCYDKERCICNLFLLNDFDEEEMAYIIREYKENYFNKEKLYSYANILGCYKEIKNIFKVLIWE